MRLLLLILVLYSCKNNKTNTTGADVDTSELIVKNDTIINVNFERHNLKAAYYFDITEEKSKIVFYDNHINRKIELPNPESQAKNFSVESLEETKEGFLMKANYGGGNNYYTREFFFNIDNVNNSIYLYKVKGSFIDYSSNSKGQTTEKVIEPKIRIENLNILDFISNDKI